MDEAGDDEAFGRDGLAAGGLRYGLRKIRLMSLDLASQKLAVVLTT